MTQNKPKVYLPTRQNCDLVTEDHSFLERFISYNVDQGRAELTRSPKSADLIVLFQEWSFKLPPYAQQLAENKLVRDFSEKIYVVNYDCVVGEGFLPGCYVSLREGVCDPKTFIPCAYPKTYNHLFSEPRRPETSPKHLFSFRGTLHSHPLRQTMFDALSTSLGGKVIDNTKEFHTHTLEDKEAYLEDLTNSMFVLCPRGSSPNSYRLYETMSMGRCPVIISDDWVETPGPDWQNCSIRVAERDVKHIPAILSEREPDGKTLGTNARLEWQAHFTEEKVYQQYLDKIIELHSRQEFVTKAFDDYMKHWRSQQFLYNNEWTLHQKIARRLRKILKI